MREPSDLAAWILAAAFLAALSTSRPVVAATEFAHWPFDGCSTADVSGFAHNMSSGGNLLCTTSGRFGGAVVLDGVDAYLMWDNGTTFAPNDHAWGVAAWVKTSAATGTSYVVSWYRCGANPSCGATDAAFYQLYVANGTPVWWVRNDANVSASVYGSPIADGAWHFLVGTIDPDGQVVRLYVDGALAEEAAEAAGSLSDLIGVPLSVGRQFRQGWESPTGYFNGSLDEVRVYDGLLSDAEILSLYQTNSATPAAPSTWGAIKSLYR